MLIVRAFPPAPDNVVYALGDIDTALHGTAEQKAAAGDLRTLPRPWEPDTCGAALRRDVWAWCLDVAAWVNLHYVWQPEHMIPACWPRHPHIAVELPVLAVLRWEAHQSADALVLEEWHRDKLPGFLSRMAERLGESCSRREHQDWPAAARYDDVTSANAVDEAEARITADARAWAAHR